MRIQEFTASPYGVDGPSEERWIEAIDLKTVQVAPDFAVGYVLMNKSRLGEAPAIVAPGAFMSDLTTPSRAYEATQLAALGRPVLLLDLPGHGLSTPHTAAMTDDLCGARSADSQAAPLLDAVQRLLPAQEPFDVAAVSHGALMGLKIAEMHPDGLAGTVYGVELPAVKRRSTLGLQVGYMVLDNMIGRKQVLKELESRGLDADFNSFAAQHDNLDVQRAASFVRQNPGLFLRILITSINARPVALDAWQKLMDTTDTHVEVATGSKTHVSDPEAIAAFIDHLPVNQQLRSRQLIFAGEDHNAGIVHLMPRVVAGAQAAFAHTAAVRASQY